MRSHVGALATIAAIVGTLVAPGRQGGTRACSILPKEEVRTILGVDRKTFDLVPPSEERLAGAGSSCEYMGAGIQIDPFTPARLEEIRKTSGKEWVPVPGVGDAAYFHDRSARAPYVELYVRSGARVVTVQADVNRPTETGRDARPRAVALAKALVAKLR
jgi:hypothetical protein